MATELAMASRRDGVRGARRSPLSFACSVVLIVRECTDARPAPPNTISFLSPAPHAFQPSFLRIVSPKRPTAKEYAERILPTDGDPKEQAKKRALVMARLLAGVDADGKEHKMSDCTCKKLHGNRPCHYHLCTRTARARKVTGLDHAPAINT